MFDFLKNRSLYQQLTAPIFAVGVLGLLAITYSSSSLNSAVSALGNAFITTGKTLQRLENIEVSLAELRALSLRHLASESYAAMEEIKIDIKRARSEMIEHLNSARAKSDGHDSIYNKELLQLKQLTGAYLNAINEVITISEDFEKELAFGMWTAAESRHLPHINDVMHRLKRHAFEDVSKFRNTLTDDARKNLVATTIIGVACIILLFAFSFVVARRVTLRIEHILAWSKQVASGNFSAQLVSDANDEVGRLTRSMQQMASSISQAHKELDGAKNRAERTADELQLYANAFESSGEAMLITDKDNRIINVNDAFERQTGYKKDEVLGKNPKMFSSGKTQPSVYQKMWSELDGYGFWQGELWDKKKSGDIYPKWIRISSIRDEQDRVLFYIASFADISERKESEARIEHLAHHDILTGLHNRFSMEERLEQSIVTAHRSEQRLAVLFIDLDKFKSVNDSLGHHAGDKLLNDVAQRLKTCVRESDIIARIGGDEFVIVLTDINDSSNAAIVARDVLAKIAEPYTIGEQLVTTTPSIGISIYPDDGKTVDDLMRTADVAMYHAKDDGRNTYHYFTESMLIAANERIRIERDLRTAVEDNQLTLYYQPQIATRDSRIVALEALVRWHHPQQGLIPPDMFIGIAEESGIIHQLGNWVINEACRQIAEWKARGEIACKVALNISARQLQSPTLADEIRDTLELHRLTGSDLELEVTESVAMSNPEFAVIQLQRLQKLGISLAIDDFGTGYSSLAYLKRLPIDILKLDRSFVRDIETDENDAEICSATVVLAHNLGLKVVAEGVETQQQCDFLEKLHCDFLQGYLFSKPLPADEVAQMIARHGEKNSKGS